MGDQESTLGRRAFLAGATGALAGCGWRPSTPPPVETERSRRDDTPTDRPQRTSTPDDRVEVYRRNVITPEVIEQVSDWQDVELDNLEWSEIDERREDLEDLRDELEEDLDEEDLELPLDEGAYEEFQDGILFFREDGGNDRGTIFLADYNEHDTRFETTPPAFFPDRSVAERRDDPFETPGDAGEIDEDYDDFLEDSRIPEDFLDESENAGEEALEIMANVVPYLGDESRAPGLQINERFIDLLIGDSWDNDDGLLEYAERRVENLASGWRDFVNGGENNSVTRYMRRIAGNEDIDRAFIDNLKEILENPTDRRTQFVSAQEARRGGYVTVEEAEELYEDMEEIENAIVERFLQDRDYAAQLSMTAKMLQHTREELRNKANDYFFEDSEDYEEDIEFEATYDDVDEIIENIEDLEDDRGADGLNDLFGDTIRESRTWRREFLPEELVEELEDDEDMTIPLRYLRRFSDGDFDESYGDIREIRFFGEVREPFEDYEDPDYDAEFDLDYIELDIRKEDRWDRETFTVENDDPRNYLMRYFIDRNLDIDYG